MDVVSTLAERNVKFVNSDFSADLKIMPSMKTVIIGCVDPYRLAPGALAQHLGVEESALGELAITDAHKAVAIDVAALRANPHLPGGFIITGVVYDVATGRVEVVVPPGLLRVEAQP